MPEPVYAWWTYLPIDPKSPAPRTGWIHEEDAPHRVIVFESAPIASRWVVSRSFEVREYDGTEDTVPWQEVWPHLA